MQDVGILVYWHLLSLDAPCVAALWTAFLTRQFHTHLPFAATLALALAVWVLYVADRVHDAAKGDLLQARHRFHLLYRHQLLLGAVLAGCVVLLLLTRLPASLRTAWLLLALPLAVYVLAVHVLHLCRVPKEPLVAVFFATAAALPVLVSGGAAGMALTLAASSFGLVCWLNCAAIARWEGMLLAADPLTRWLGAHLDAGAWLVALLMAPALFMRGSTAVAVASLTAAACLVQLHRKRDLLSPETLRALADAALLTPLVVWPASAWLHLL